MYKIYILQSLINQKYYTGHTNDLVDRLNKHNAGKVKSTKNGRPWRVVYTEKYKTRSEDYRRELKIKSYKGGRAFKNLIK